ncbi:outer membrane beta-barrel protein [Shinella kummerowiae]|jgi:outer membrane immunogenic protein|uniref:Outer membrane beta-barrel protein n=1 Tax=Shinella kummerowiae TaxID=417745 RepID=A0A6N8S587_9HYPH|nr:outer membrane protein [Shinella kummerowiae]MXN43943.1 outer membrane beta-barrel protein [Shinella kummerowiae]
MKSMLFGAAGILVTAGTLPAFAADVAISEPPVETPIVETAAGVYDWGGFYVGVNTGYAWTNASSDGPAPAIDQSLDGFALGAFAGYNIYNNGWVYGVEADIKHDFNNDRFSSGGTDYEAETNWGGSVRARLGYAFDRTLIYATGGWAFTRAELENKDTGVREKDTAHGWTIGAGVEQAITDTVAGRLEYRYTDYRNSDIFNAAGRDGDLDSHSIMLGVSMKF